MLTYTGRGGVGGGEDLDRTMAPKRECRPLFRLLTVDVPDFTMEGRLISFSLEWRLAVSRWRELTLDDESVRAK